MYKFAFWIYYMLYNEYDKVASLRLNFLASRIYSPSSSSSSSQFHVSMVLRILGFLFFFCNGASGTTVTIVNDCGFTVWPGISASPYFNSTGFELKKGNSRSFQSPDGSWQAFIWGRTGCNFTKSGKWSCATGDCGSGEVECFGNIYTAPVTFAEFIIYNSVRMDTYFVSLDDGFNLPILVETTGGYGSGLRNCAKTGCIDDLNQRCPKELNVSGGGACRTACQAFGSPEYCCGTISTPTTCKPTTYAQLFKSACPRSYNTAIDDPTTLYTCKSADYTVKFCPAAESFSTIKHGGQLDSTDQLVSIRGNFTLGFVERGFRRFRNVRSSK